MKVGGIPGEDGVELMVAQRDQSPVLLFTVHKEIPSTLAPGVKQRQNSVDWVRTVLLYYHGHVHPAAAGGGGDGVAGELVATGGHAAGTGGDTVAGAGWGGIAPRVV